MVDGVEGDDEAFFTLLVIMVVVVDGLGSEYEGEGDGEIGLQEEGGRDDRVRVWDVDVIIE